MKREHSHSPARQFVLATAIAIFGALGLTQAFADTGQAQQQPPPPLTSAEVQDEELEQFLRSLTEIGGIQKELESRLAAVQEQQEAQRLQQAANAEMIEVITACDLEVERYNRLAQSISAVPDLGQRYQALAQAVEHGEKKLEPCRTS